jgi:hypothetical protein
MQALEEVLPRTSYYRLIQDFHKRMPVFIIKISAECDS